MTLSFTSLGLKGGVWEGILQARPRPARVALTLHGRTVGVADVASHGADQWRVSVALPPETIATGVQIYLLIADDGKGTEGPRPETVLLAQLPLLAGEALDDDLRAEIDLLRSEIDLIKRELRRLATE